MTKCRSVIKSISRVWYSRLEDGRAVKPYRVRMDVHLEDGDVLTFDEDWQPKVTKAEKPNDAPRR